MSHITRVVCYTTFGQLMIRLQPVLSSASVLCFRGSELIQQGEPHICLSKLMHSLFMREWSQINWKQIENNLKEGELFWYSCCWQLATVVYSQNFRRNGANGNSTKENSQLWFTINGVWTLHCKVYSVTANETFEGESFLKIQFPKLWVTICDRLKRIESFNLKPNLYWPFSSVLFTPDGRILLSYFPWPIMESRIRFSAALLLAVPLLGVEMTE